ncbi:hypothetical protein [Streptomyces marianii]|uniref:hypothetical protein n=1 Tax=Streptomyces marianii TaxID=1817406 RepID=UPI001F30BB52|nr:hypothetical protein [Streptomyces marianii]
MTIAAEYGVRARLREVVDAEKSRARVLSSAWRTYGVPRAEAASARAGWRKERQRLHAEGQLLDTVDALVEFGVREELRARGWDRQWPAAPEEAWDQGRWPGSRDGGFPDRVSARLDGILADQVVAACWATSREAVEALRRWRDANPGITAPRVRLDEAGRERLVGPLAEYERLSALVTTTGEIWRSGLARGLGRGAVLVRESAGGFADQAGDTTG